MSVTKDKLNTIATLMIENFEVPPRSYSGRGMFGEYCLGFTYGSHQQYLSDVLTLLADLEKPSCTLEEFRLVFTSYSYDSMGRSDIIIYFPSIEWNQYWNPDDDDDEDDD